VFRLTITLVGYFQCSGNHRTEVSTVKVNITDPP